MQIEAAFGHVPGLIEKSDIEDVINHAIMLAKKYPKKEKK